MSEERKVALITGITGQDGSYLTELLLEKGYTVSFNESSVANDCAPHSDSGLYKKHSSCVVQQACPLVSS